LKAVVYRGASDLRVEELPIPVPERGEILVRIEASGICGTDLKKIQSGRLSPPRVFGHEMAGTVAGVGPGAAGYREGDRVVLHHHIPCGSCFYCGHRNYAQCETYRKNGTTAGFEPSGGGYSQFVKALPWIVERGVIPVPDGVTGEEAIFVEPVNTCLKAVRRAGIERGQTVLVVGQGPIGLLLLQLARWAGADVFTSDPVPERLAVSRALGAQTALDAAQDVPREVRGLTEGRGVDCVLLAAVGPAAFRQAFDAARPGGRIMVFAATSPGESAEVDLGVLCASEKEILTSYSSSVDVQDLAARLVFSRELRVRELITRRFPLDRAKEAFALAARPERDTLKVVLEPHGMGAR
jgi:L-iditol 2-dehydrogenase